MPLTCCFPSLTGCGMPPGSVCACAHVRAVYALGIYVDSNAAKKALFSHKAKREQDLCNDQKLFDGEVLPWCLQTAVPRLRLNVKLAF